MEERAPYEPVSRPREEKEAVEFILMTAATVLVSASESRDAMQRRSKQHLSRLRATVGEETLEVIRSLAGTMRRLAQHLVRCPNPEALSHAHGFIEDLIAGRVYIMDTTDPETLETASRLPTTANPPPMGVDHDGL